MIRNNNDIDNLFRKGFKNFNPEPPDHVWENIYNGLEEEKPYVKGYPVWFKVAATVAALIVPAFFLLWLLPMHQEDEIADNTGISLEVEKPIANVVDLEESTVLTSTGEQTIAVNAVEEKADSYTYEPILSTAEKMVPQVNVSKALPEIKHLNTTALNTEIEALDISKIAIAENITIKNTDEHRAAPSSIDVKERRRYSSSLSASIAPQYSSNYFFNPADGSIGIPYDNLENNLKTYSFNLKYSLQTSNRFTFETGLNYFTIGQLVHDILSFGVQEEMISNTGNSLSDMPLQSALTSLGEVSFTNKSYYFADIVSFRISTEKDSPFNEPVLLGQSNDKISQYLSFVDIPLIARYSLFNYNNADIALRLGVSGSVLVSNNVYLGHGDFGQVVGLTKGVNKFSMAGIGGLSVNLPVTGNINFKIDPTARVFITPMTDNNFGGKSYPISLFINTGISYRF